jgi:hypothetical protein
MFYSYPDQEQLLLRSTSNSAPASNTIVADTNTSGEAAPSTATAYEISELTADVAEDAEGEIDFNELQVTADSGSQNPQTIPFSTLDPEYGPNNDDGSPGSSLWWLWFLIAIVALALIIIIAYKKQKDEDESKTGYVAAPAEGKPYKITSKDNEDLISSIQPARRISTKYAAKPENKVYEKKTGGPTQKMDDFATVKKDNP